MDFSYSLAISAAPLSVEQLTAIHWMHRIGALLAVLYLSWLSAGIMALKGLRSIGNAILGLVALQFGLGIFNVIGLSLEGAVLHNAVAMLLVAALAVLTFRLRHDTGGTRI
jgi:cytochrome c oxidase assembly protein subunit 15